jgi:hypothetical protein
MLWNIREVVRESLKVSLDEPGTFEREYDQLLQRQRSTSAPNLLQHPNAPPMPQCSNCRLTIRIICQQPVRKLVSKLVSKLVYPAHRTTTTSPTQGSSTPPALQCSNAPPKPQCSTAPKCSNALQHSNTPTALQHSNTLKMLQLASHICAYLMYADLALPGICRNFPHPFVFHHPSPNPYFSHVPWSWTTLQFFIDFQIQNVLRLRSRFCFRLSFSLLVISSTFWFMWVHYGLNRRPNLYNSVQFPLPQKTSNETTDTQYISRPLTPPLVCLPLVS